MFWGLLLHLALVLAVLNRLIWFRSRHKPQTNDREMFGVVSTSFGGADFWSAAAVVAINIVAGQVPHLWTGPGTTADLSSSQTLSWLIVGRAWLLQAAVLGAYWGVIAWRNRPFLDWKWSGAAALLIYAVPIVVVALAAVLSSF